MLVVNTGHTPAYNVRHRANVNFLPFPLPADFDFPLPDPSSEGSLVTVNPQQNYIASGIAPRVYTDDEVTEIKRGGPDRRLYMWGRVDYNDVFGNGRYVNFCQSFIWLSDGNVMSYNTRRHNESD